MSKRLVVIVGPTAGGKSELAFALAGRFHGEILSADSMQVYRGLDAGTAKPPQEWRRAIPHHLLDVVEPDQPWTVADWVAAAESLIADLHARAKLPIVVGGTNLYLKALLEGMFDGPPADESFRREVADVPTPDLHRRLREVDPAAAQRIHVNDRKRTIRALEVFHQTGRAISAQQTQWIEGFSQPVSLAAPPVYRHDPILIGLHWPTERINRRINARVKSMFPALIEETRRLRDSGRLGPQAAKALGTAQVLDHLAGRMDLEQTIEQVKILTRQYAKTQRTWLKRYRGVHWLEASELADEALHERAAEIVKSELGRSTASPV